jgi:hypothetical protein
VNQKRRSLRKARKHKFKALIGRKFFSNAFISVSSFRRDRLGVESLTKGNCMDRFLQVESSQDG